MTQQTRTTPSAQKHLFYKNPLISSDESDTDVLPINQPPLFSGNVNDWITDDESEANKPKSTTTSKTSASYKTCLTQLTYKIEISEDESDEATPVKQMTSLKLNYEMTDDESDKEVEVVQETITVTVSTPGTPKLVEVSSCEKVTRWLQRNPTPTSSPKVVRCLELPPSKEPQTTSQATSSGYPDTFASNPSRFSSVGATSRQGSSPEDPLLPSQNSQPTSENTNNQRNSLLNSQTTSSSRSSSFYFKDRAPWSNSSPAKKKIVRRKPCPPKYSDVTEWSDAKSHLDSQETGESIRLQIEASENEENMLFSINAHLLAQQEEVRIPSQRKSSRTTSSESYAKTWERRSEVFASSDECNSNPKPLHDLTNFNPIFSSTQRDSVFRFPSYSEDGRELLDSTLQKSDPKAETSANKNNPGTQCEEQNWIVISSSDDDSDNPSAKHNRAESKESDEERESSNIAVRRRKNTRASYIEHVISETESEDETPRRPTEHQVISETEEEEDDDDEEKEEDVEKQQARKCSILDVDERVETSPKCAAPPPLIRR